MLTALIILGTFVLLAGFVRWANTPTKKHPNPLGPGKSIKKIENVFDLISPRLEEWYAPGVEVKCRRDRR